LYLSHLAILEELTITFTCRSYSKDVQWRLNQLSLPHNARAGYVQDGAFYNHTLTIINVNFENDGVYSCNRFGFGFLRLSGQ